MRHIVLAAILLPTIAAAQMPNGHPRGTRLAKPECQQANAERVGTGQTGRTRKLGEMPDARAIYTVVREIDGCPIPVRVAPR